MGRGPENGHEFSHGSFSCLRLDQRGNSGAAGIRFGPGSEWILPFVTNKHVSVYTSVAYP